MTTIVVLFNLKSGVSVADYERFALEMDIPEVNRLASVEKFEVFKAQGLMGGGASPYAYVEILRVRDPEQLGKDVQSATMQQVVSTFRSMADNPLFIVTAPL
jgi:hypothetical protein